MAWSGNIITHCSRAIGPQKYGSGINNFLHQPLRVAYKYLKMLRSDPVGDLRCLLQVLGQDDRAAGVTHQRLYFLGQAFRIRDQKVSAISCATSYAGREPSVPSTCRVTSGLSLRILSVWRYWEPLRAVRLV